MAIGILGMGSALPDQIIDNTDLCTVVDNTPEWILSRTGIQQRRIADLGTSTSDLASQAARQALTDAGVDRNEVGLLILASSSPDWLMPATACAVQRDLGLGLVPAFDISGACAGFLYGFVLAEAFLTRYPQTGHALVIGAETMSRLLDPDDGTASVFFGDGAGAVVLGPVPEGSGILSTTLLSDGAGFAIAGIPAGGSVLPASPETVAKRQHFFRMDGRKVWDWAITNAPKVVSRVLDDAGIDPADVDLFVLHQANKRLVHAALSVLGVGPERTFTTVEWLGNTAAASVPLTLHEAVRQQRVTSGCLVVLAAVGAGMNAGAAVLRMS